MEPTKDYNIIKDYVVFDLETTGLITTGEIIEIGALRVRDNQVVDTFQTFSKPEFTFKEPQVSRITNEMVKNAPNGDTAVDNFLEFVGDDVVMGFNSSTFDIPFIKTYNKPFLNFDIDVLLLSRIYLLGPENHELSTLKDYYNLDFNSHRAIEDCYTTKAIYDLCVMRKLDRVLFEKEKLEYESKPHVITKKDNFNAFYMKPNFTETTKELQQFKIILEDITSDDEISEQEVNILKEWMESHKELNGNYPFDKIDLEIEKILLDGIITTGEKEELLNIIENFIKPANDDSTKVEFVGNIFVKTGDFEYGDEKKVKEYIESKGGIFQKNFTQKANYVVIGNYGSQAWSKGNFGNKVEQAKKYNDNPKATHHIFIITEKQLFEGEKL